PYAHPAVLNEPTGAFGVPRKPIGTRRLGAAFLVIGLAWIFGTTLASTTLVLRMTSDNRGRVEAANLAQQYIDVARVDGQTAGDTDALLLPAG
ncbi:hypothetical protein IAE22_34275, partial [Bacillus sp. S34]|nr:hypothetical protein [Bacillus sp. S34]